MSLVTEVSTSWEEKVESLWQKRQGKGKKGSHLGPDFTPQAPNPKFQVEEAKGRCGPSVNTGPEENIEMAPWGAWLVQWVDLCGS